MKRILLAVVLSLTFLAPSFGDALEFATPKKEDPKSICPVTRRLDCTTCHVASDNSLKEKNPSANRVFPGYMNMGIRDDGKTAYLLITTINAGDVADFFGYLRWHPEIIKAVFEIYSPGGSLFDAWRIVGMMELWKSRGLEIETRVYGFAASAGFIIFLNGSERYASKTAELMWHELYSFAMFKVTRPSDSEDEAIIMRHLQDTANQYLSERSKLTKEEWNKKVHKKEFWCNGEEAIKFGISDGEPK